MKLWILHVSPWSLGTVNDGEKTISLINCHQITGITSNSNSFKYHLILSKERSILLCELLILEKDKIGKNSGISLSIKNTSCGYKIFFRRGWGWGATILEER